MNSNHLYLMHESFPPLHLDFSPNFLHSKKPKVQSLILQENILRGYLASKKKKIVERKRKAKRALYFTKCKIYNMFVYLRDDFHPSYSFYKSQACDWLITGIRKEFTSKNTKENISCGVGKTKEISHQRRMGWCEFRTRRKCCANFAQAEGVVRISHKLGAVVF